MKLIADMKVQNPIMMIFSNKLSTYKTIMITGLKTKKRVSLQIILTSVLLSVLLFNSCANQGVGPSGGPRDSIPPVVTSSIPTPAQTMFSGKEITFTFNEYIALDNLSEKLVISPPLAKKPEIKTSGKSITIKIAEDLIPDRTYSFDLQDGIIDYNEKNKLKSLRMVFSTGPQLDTLRIGGYILDALTLLPVKNTLATLYTFDNDSVFRHLKPDFIARTNEEGYFLFDNLPPDQYKLFGLTDDDKNLYYSQATELIAFSDSMISPSVHFVSQPDTVISGNDTVISKGYNEYIPDNVTILLFEEDTYNQFNTSSKRVAPDRCLIVFSESVTDSFKVELVDTLARKNWSEFEFSENRDTVSVFITDSTLIKTDTLRLSIKYTVTDSTGNFIAKTDTLEFLQSKPEKSKTKKKEETPADDTFFKFSTNLVASNFDLNKKIVVEAPSPIETLNKEMISLSEIINDSTQQAVNFELQTLKGSKRKFQLLVSLVENTKYQLTIDSAIVKTISGKPNAALKTKFSTQKADYYGSIILSLSGIQGKGKVLLVKFNEKSDKEDIITELSVEKPQQNVVFDFLKPEKYILKFVSDLNNNGKWDTGNLSTNRQPEPVSYFQKVINVKSNWEIKENWELITGPIKAKKIVDESKEEKKSGK